MEEQAAEDARQPQFTGSEDHYLYGNILGLNQMIALPTTHSFTAGVLHASCTLKVCCQCTMVDDLS